MIVDSWHRCYSDSWNGLIVPDAFSHPAKVARGLSARIYQHMAEEGWIEPGQIIVDPFCGIGGFALDALLYGLVFVGNELEPKFHALSLANYELWTRRYSTWPKWGRAVFLCGDSRRLASVIAEAGAAISSPPYASNTVHATGNSLHPDKFKEPWRVGRTSHAVGECQIDEYGDTPGQLGRMAEGNLDAAVTSPPYASDTTSTFSQRAGKTTGTGQIGRGEFKVGRCLVEMNKQGYSLNPENLGTMPETIGNDQGETFWTAARTILEQLHMVLKPGAHAVFVVKSFVRDGKIVDFPGQWAALCEACGFRLLHVHRAWLVEERGTQIDLNGDHVQKRVERKSFFRRLAEKNGSPRIDYETVQCFERVP